MFKCIPVFYILLLTGFSISSAHGQHCATMKNLERHIARSPELMNYIERYKLLSRQRLAADITSPSEGQILTIPVVVHVIWHRTLENVSDAQIQSQIDALNRDYRLRNADSLRKTHPFWPSITDTKIEFCLAKRDPNGNPTSGITRTMTDTVAFYGIGSEKRTALGGMDNWNPDKYLNLWVCNLDGGGEGILGYASFPFERLSAPEDDGVVIDYRSFGTMGTAQSPNALGRTATHEIGHWMDLYHIWGDLEPDCGDDDVLDTPPGDEPNYDCPSFPQDPNSVCGTDENGEMYMNYMDYVVDGCMVMFTKGQAARMQTSLKNDRPGLFTSLGCSTPSDVDEGLLSDRAPIYPQPSSGVFTVNFSNPTPGRTTITLLNLLGEPVYALEGVIGTTTQINVPHFGSGVYYLMIQSAYSTITERVIITQ